MTSFLRYYLIGALGLVPCLEVQAQEAETKSASRSDSAKSSTPRKKKTTQSGAEKSSTPRPVAKKKTDSEVESVSPGTKKKKAAVVDDEDAPAPTKTPTPPSEPDPAVTPSERTSHAPAASIATAELAEFSKQPARIQELITAALDLTKLNLTYTYGSADPSSGGMDCSGAIYYLLRQQGLKDVPRDSSSQYVWARKGGQFFAVVSTQADSFEFKDLQPGDLMFWSGTYNTGRTVPISHVMLYLGREKGSGKSVMFGSSDGRSYNGVSRWGVSVFDFKMPKADPNKPEKRVDFVGYARIPGLRESPAVVALSVTEPTRVPAVVEAVTPPADAKPLLKNILSNTAPEPRVGPRGVLREPPRGSPERKAIMDALRAGSSPQLPRGVVFQVRTLKIQDDWAWAEVTPLNDQNKPIGERQKALLQLEDGQWKPVNLDKLSEVSVNSAESSKNNSALVKALLEAYPGVPPDILPSTRK